MKQTENVTSRARTQQKQRSFPRVYGLVTDSDGDSRVTGKMKSESNFLDFLRGGNDSTMTGRRYNNAAADESDSGHGSPTRELDDDEPSIRKPSFWRRFTIKGARNKR